MIVAIGDFISAKTKGVISTILVAMILYIAGYNLGIIPTTSLGETGLLTVTASFGMMIVVTNLGTMIDIRSFLKEWKIVVISIFTLAVMGVIFLTFGAALFGLDYALTAYPPVAGGATAVVMVADHASSIGRPELSSFAWFLVTLQMFVGIPIASFFLKRYCAQFVKTDEFKTFVIAGEEASGKTRRLIPPIPAKYNSANTILAKVLVVTWFSSFLGSHTPIPAAIYCLIFGVLGCEIGLLDRQALQKSGMLNLAMFCMMASAPSSFATLSIPDLLSMLLPVAFFLIVGGAALSIGGALIGKILHVPASLAIPLALNAMFGFPFNIMITDDVVRTMGLNEDDTAKLKAIVQPKMTIAGFASMTIMSVVIAALVIPYIH